MSQAVCWSSEEEEILIDFVRSHELLYNVKCKDYRKTQLKQNLWRKIGGILNKTDIECSKKWAYIRDYYIRRRRKPGPGSSGKAAKKRSNLLLFLEDYSSVKRSSITNIQGPAIENTGNVQELDDGEDESVSEDLDNCQLERSLDHEEEASSSQRDAHYSSKKRKNDHFEERLRLLKQIVSKHQQSQSLQSIQQQDETDLFFASMAKSLKKLPEYERVRLRMEIGRIVGSAEIQHLSQQRPPRTSSAASSTASSSSSDSHW